MTTQVHTSLTAIFQIYLR